MINDYIRKINLIKSLNNLTNKIYLLNINKEFKIKL